MPDQRSLLLPNSSSTAPELTAFGTYKANYDADTELTESSIEGLDAAIAAAKSDQEAVTADYRRAVAVVRRLREERSPILDVISRADHTLMVARDDHSWRRGTDLGKYGRVSQQRKVAKRAFEDGEEQLQDALRARSRLTRRRSELERVISALESTKRHALKRTRREEAQRAEIASVRRQLLAGA